MRFAGQGACRAPFHALCGDAGMSRSVSCDDGAGRQPEPMKTMSDTTYDALPYEDLAFFHTHPANLAAVAMLCGLRAPPIERCSVLELGCGAGFNLIAMSASLPGARLVGIDFSRRQIEAGRELAARAGAANVDLRVGDVAALDDSLGRFDYVIAHGLLSWVPAAVREAVFRACSRHLQPDGIAYLSYNTYPGWHLRSVLLDALRFHAGSGGTPLERVHRARAALARMAGDLPEADASYARFLRSEIESLRDDADAYVFHEFLEADNHPLHFAEFCAQAAANGLRYVAEARYGNSAAAQRGDMRRKLDAVSTEPLRQEQYHDLLRNRRFRQSLLCHADRMVLARPPQEALDGLTIIGQVERLPAEANGVRPFRLHDGSTVRDANPLFAAILARLAQAWPRPLGVRELADAVDADLAGVAMPPGATRHAVVLEGVIIGYGWGWWHLLARTPAAALVPGERPRALELVRLGSDRPQAAVNLLHMPVDLDAVQRAVVARLDGRTPLEEIAQALEMTTESVGAVVDGLAASYLLHAR